MSPVKAGVGRFLWLWLPPLAIFLAGLHRAWLTGQTDPWDWGLPMMAVLAVIGLLIARRGWLMQLWVAMGTTGMVLIFCTLSAGRAPGGAAMAGLLAVGICAVFGGAWLCHFPFASKASRLHAKQMGKGAGVALLILAGLLVWRGPAQPVQPVPDRPALAVITALPLFWDEVGRIGPRDAPIVSLLRSRFAVMPMDDPIKLAESGVKRLLLAQPRALSPAQLVAIDHWVRNGGTALVLADPMLRWPSDLPLGDRRRAPSATLLHPLLAHWGFQPFDLDPQEIRHFMADGHLLTLSGARAYGAGADGPGIQRRAIGRGQALLLGDADAIDDRLWLADPARPLDPRFWVADTPALIIKWLGGAAIPGDRRWMREAADVRGGLRWAVLAGMIWAIMGLVALRRRGGGSGPGTKSESMTNIDRKSG